MNKNLLKQYARLVSGEGINEQKGQTVLSLIQISEPTRH